MGEYKIKVILLDEALAFVRSLPIKVQEKIVYNYKKIENGLMSKELFKKYGIYADNETCRAYAASKIRSDITGGGDGVVVLVARNSPCLDSQFVAHNLGESPVMTDNVKYAFTPVSLDRPALNKDDIQGLESILNSL